MLLPALSKAKSSAQVAECISRLRDNVQQLVVFSDDDEKGLELLDRRLRVAVPDRQAELRLQTDDFFDVQRDIAADLRQPCRSLGKVSEPGCTDQGVTASHFVTDFSEIGGQGDNTRQGFGKFDRATDLVNEDPAMYRWHCQQTKHYGKEKVFHRI